MTDVLVVGGGHNALVTACYLAKAGLSVTVCERRPIVGGAVVTEEVIPGYQFDIGSSCHIMIHLTPILKDLELETRFGLEYCDLDPFAFHPLEDGRWFAFYRDLDRTCASIATVSPKDAETYREFVRFWGQFNEGVFAAFLKPPTMANFGREMMLRMARQGDGAKGHAKALGLDLGKHAQTDLLRKIFTNYGALIDETFEHPAVRSALTWLAAQSGPGPTEIATGEFFGWHSMLHTSGAKHPKGGSGMLTQAMARCLEAHGGTIRLDAEVARIDVESGKAVGVTLKSGEQLRARAVVSGAHVQTTLLDLLRPEDAPLGLQKRVERVKVGNGFGMAVRFALNALPDYPGFPTDGSGDCHQGMQLLCPSTEFLMKGYNEYLRGEPSSEPPVLGMTFTPVDPGIAPPGKHSMFAWSQYHPYDLAGGQHWDDIREREADRITATITRYAPGFAASVEGRFIQTPLDLERRLGLRRGNVMHVEMSLDQMFMFRPLPELATYKTPLEGLYLTGASTHPGGGVFGASGYNAAKVMLKDLKPKRGLFGLGGR